MVIVRWLHIYYLLSKRRSIFVFTLLFIAVLLFFCFFPILIDSDFSFGKTRYSNELIELSFQSSNDNLSINSSLKEEVTQLRRLLSQQNETNYVYLVQEYEYSKSNRLIEQGDIDEVTQRNIQFKQRFLSLLSSRPNPCIYDTSNELPAILFICYFLGTIPTPAWCLIPVILLFLIARESLQERFISVAPFSYTERIIFFVTYGSISTFVCTAIICLPAFIVMLIRNGLGDELYPVIYWSGSELITSNLIMLLMNYSLLLLGLGALIGCCAALCISSKNMWLYSLTALLLLPSAFDDYYFSFASSLPSIASVLPTTYTSLERLFGRPGGIGSKPQIEIISNSHLRAIIILITTFLIIFLLSLLFLYLKRGRWYKKINQSALQRHADNSFAAPKKHLESHLSFTAHDIHVGFRHSEHLIDGCLCLHRQQVVGLISPNGYGKTSLIHALAGIPTQGSLRTSVQINISCIRDRQLDILTPRDSDFYNLVFFLPSEGKGLFNHLSVIDNLNLAHLLWSQSQNPKDILKKTISNIPATKHVYKLSQGMRQQVALAVAYCTGCPVLLLDEPFNALDQSSRKQHHILLEHHARAGGIVLISSHMLHNLDDLCGNALFLMHPAIRKVARTKYTSFPRLYNYFYN